MDKLQTLTSQLLCSSLYSRCIISCTIPCRKHQSHANFFVPWPRVQGPDLLHDYSTCLINIAGTGIPQCIKSIVMQLINKLRESCASSPNFKNGCFNMPLISNGGHYLSGWRGRCPRWMQWIRKSSFPFLSPRSPCVQIFCIQIYGYMYIVRYYQDWRTYETQIEHWTRIPPLAFQVAVCLVGADPWAWEQS